MGKMVLRFERNLEVLWDKERACWKSGVGKGASRSKQSSSLLCNTWRLVDLADEWFQMSIRNDCN